MPNITRGGRMGGLMVYLAGDGRANEHTDPHLVAGDPAIMAWHDDAVLDRASALAIARHLDDPARVFGTQVLVADKDADGNVVGHRDGHVWHCSLSLRADEGQLTDEQWSQIATAFVDRMGFTESGGKAACRWVAVRHGLSKAGNDHVHVAVNLVREDGTKASVWNDRRHAQRIAGELEKEHGLVVLESREAARGARGVKPGEQARQERTGAPEPERVTLARRVRAAATASVDEAEFVRRTRREGLLIRPRFAAGREDVVAGYSVAVRPPAGETVVWFGGGHLARDLTLPRLREQWPDTPQAASEAVAEWRAARRGQRPVAPGREHADPDPDLWQQYASEIGELRDRLRSVPVDDTATWAQVARETSGAFAAWSTRVEPVPGPLAATSDALARFGTTRPSRVPKASPSAAVKGASRMLLAAAHGGQSKTAQAVMFRQMVNLTRALYQAHRAIGQAQAAGQIERAVRGQLATVAAGLPAIDAHGHLVPESDVARARRVAAAGQVPAAAIGSPVPNRLEPGREVAHTTAAEQRDQGHER